MAASAALTSFFVRCPSISSQTEFVVHSVGPASTVQVRNCAAFLLLMMPSDFIWRSHTSSCVVKMNWVSGKRDRSEEHTSELQSLMRISYAVFCLKKNILTHT